MQRQTRQLGSRCGSRIWFERAGEGDPRRLAPGVAPLHQADQVNQLVSASEADPDLGFMARLMALCCLPRTNPGNRHQYKRVNGPFKLIMIAVADNKLPYGNLPRLLLAGSRPKQCGPKAASLSWGRRWQSSCGTLGVYSSGGRPQTSSATRCGGSLVALFTVYEGNSGSCA